MVRRGLVDGCCYIGGGLFDVEAINGGVIKGKIVHIIYEGRFEGTISDMIRGHYKEIFFPKML